MVYWDRDLQNPGSNPGWGIPVSGTRSPFNSLSQELHCSIFNCNELNKNGLKLSFFLDCGPVEINIALIFFSLMNRKLEFLVIVVSSLWKCLWRWCKSFASCAYVIPCTTSYCNHSNEYWWFSAKDECLFILFHHVFSAPTHDQYELKVYPVKYAYGFVVLCFDLKISWFC